MSVPAVLLALAAAVALTGCSTAGSGRPAERRPADPTAKGTDAAPQADKPIDPGTPRVQA
jgi:hypothetical protein